MHKMCLLYPVPNMLKLKGFYFSLLGHTAALCSLCSCLPGQVPQQGSPKSHPDTSTSGALWFTPAYASLFSFLSISIAPLVPNLVLTMLSKGFRLLPASFCVTLDIFWAKKAFAVGARENMRCFRRELELPDSQEHHPLQLSSVITGLPGLL